MSAASINPSPSGHSGYSASLPPSWETSVLQDHFSLGSLPPLPPKPAPVAVAGSLYQKVTHSSPYFPFLIFLLSLVLLPSVPFFQCSVFQKPVLVFLTDVNFCSAKCTNHSTQHAAFGSSAQLISALSLFYIIQKFF